jgi:hypothetical protein
LAYVIIIFASEGSGCVGAVDGGVIAIEDGHIKERCAVLFGRGGGKPAQPLHHYLLGQ